MAKSKFTNLPASEQDKSKTVSFHDDAKNGVTVCRLYDRWNRRFFTAKTRVHDVDQYDQQTGRAIAFNKARRKELLNDLVRIDAERAYLTKRYEDLMNKLDKREGLKHIYLMGVEDELNELMGMQCKDGEPDSCGFFSSDDEAGLQADALVAEEQKEERDLSKIKLKQFANFTEKEIV